MIMAFYSSGCGLTGIFCTIDTVLELLKKLDEFNFGKTLITDIVEKFRTQRTQTVNTLVSNIESQVHFSYVYTTSTIGTIKILLYCNQICLYLCKWDMISIFEESLISFRYTEGRSLLNQLPAYEATTVTWDPICGNTSKLLLRSSKIKLNFNLLPNIRHHPLLPYLSAIRLHGPMINRINSVYYLNKNTHLPKSFQHSPVLLALTVEFLASQSYAQHVMQTKGLNRVINVLIRLIHKNENGSHFFNEKFKMKLTQKVP